MPQKRITIIGAGPIGIEAALLGRSLGHAVTLYERGQLADNVRAWGFVRLFSPWKMNVSDLGIQTLGAAGAAILRESETCPTGHEFRERYLLPLTRSPLLANVLRENTRVIAVGRDDFQKSDAIAQPSRATSPFRLLLLDSTGAERIEHADIVLDCSGTYTNHRLAGRGGIPAPGERAAASRIFYTIPDVLGQDKARFANRHTLLIGAGYSAATVLTALSQLAQTHPQTRVSWAIRRPGQALSAVQNDPLEARRQLVENVLRLTHQPPPWLEFLGNCVLESLQASTRITARLRCGDEDITRAADEFVSLVGYAPDDSIYRQLQVHQCYATFGPMKLAAALLGQSAADCLTAGASLGPDTLNNPEPNFFILGAKSYGTNSNFLLQTGLRQVEDAYALLASTSRC